MKSLRPYFFLISFVLLGVSPSNTQNTNNQLIVQDIYDYLQDKNSTSRDIARLTGKIKWDDEIHRKNLPKNNGINFIAVLNNEYGRVLFDRLSFKEVERDKVVVTGIMSGRQATECEYISTNFQHKWSLAQGQIIGFSE